LSQHKLSECSKRLLPCRFCSKEFVADTLSAHHLKCGRVPVACPNRCDINVLAKEDLETHLKEECTVSVLSCTYKDAGCRFKVNSANFSRSGKKFHLNNRQGPRYLMEKHLEENSQQHLALVCTVVTKQQHQIASLKSALSRLSLNYSGTLIWKISDFSDKMNEAKNKEGMELVSPPFYTSQYGYKLQVVKNSFTRVLVLISFCHRLRFFPTETAPEKTLIFLSI
jgi:TNF receptor-associated factor 4